MLFTTAAHYSQAVARSRRRRRLNAAHIIVLAIALVFGGAFLASALFALPTATVNSTGDLPDSNLGDGVCHTGMDNVAGQPECTLRAAIQEANSDGDFTAISVAIPAADSNHSAGIWTIPLSSSLPPIRTPTAVDATAQSGWAGVPLVAIDRQLPDRHLDSSSNRAVQDRRSEASPS